jgi:hypothetical protein
MRSGRIIKINKKARKKEKKPPELSPPPSSLGDTSSGR